MGEILLESADRAAGVLHDSCGRARERELADRRCSLARRSRGRGYPGRKRRRATCGVDRRAAEALEVDRERLAVHHRDQPPQARSNVPILKREADLM